MEDGVVIGHPRCADADTEGLIRRMMMMRDRYKEMTSEIEPSDRMAVESDPDQKHLPWRACRCLVSARVVNERASLNGPASRLSIVP